MTSVRYSVVPADPREHLYSVTCQIDRPDPGGQVLRLPSWIRGSYLVRDFAKHVVDLRAESGGRPLAVERLDKRSLRCEPVAGPLTLSYRVYAFDNSVRKAYLDMSRGFFNGSSLFYCPAGFEHAGFEVMLVAPVDPQLASWRVATSMRPVKTDAAGFGRYRADGYEELIDHPVEMGTFERLDFDVDGVAHALVLSGRCELDRNRVIADLARICHVEREMFGQQPQLDQYLFLTNVVGNGYGGLEHRSSTALICSRKDLPRPGDASIGKDYRSFLGLCSHEYFHLWNVKRITAQAFAASDLGAEAYTRDLWHYEGVTSYYDDLFLLRAGLIDAPTYLDLVAENATRIERAPGSAVQTLADASFDAWIKYYQPDENSPNAGVSYYVKGALAALCLDLQLRLHSQVTLDDVMRAAWQRWGQSGLGVPEGGLEALAQEISGCDLRTFFDLALRSTLPLPLADLLTQFAVRAQLRPAHGDADNGGRSAGKPQPVRLGLKLRGGDTRVAHVYSGGAAAQAGVHVGDQIVAVDGWRVTAAGWQSLIERLAPGRPVHLHLFRDDQLLELQLVPQAVAEDTWTLEPVEADEAAVQRRKAWLGA